MSFSAKLRFSEFWLKQLVLGRRVSQFSGKIILNTAQRFLTTQEIVLKKAASKPQGGFCFVIKFFNSTVNKDCFSQLFFWTGTLKSKIRGV